MSLDQSQLSRGCTSNLYSRKELGSAGSGDPLNLPGTFFNCRTTFKIFMVRHAFDSALCPLAEETGREFCLGVASFLFFVLAPRRNILQQYESPRNTF